MAGPARSMVGSMQSEILRGLLATPKRIESKYFYDAVGAELFEQICELPEYYPTRTEIGMLKKRLPEIAQLIGPAAQIIEFGSGAGTKTQLLLDALERPAVYVPIDISEEQLEETSHKLKLLHPKLRVVPLAQDYTQPIMLPKLVSDDLHSIGKTVVYFPGSTIGNFEPRDAEAFLRMCRELVGSDGAMIIGVDLVKDRATLNAAYNDAEGVTAKFNLHLIERIRDELGVRIDPRDFAHHAFFNVRESRIEMHLRVIREHTAVIGEREITFHEGEEILTEYSYKYTDDRFRQLAAHAGFRLQQQWHDEHDLFAIYLLSAATD